MPQFRVAKEAGGECRLNCPACFRWCPEGFTAWGSPKWEPPYDSLESYSCGGCGAYLLKEEE